ncbi:hypothetical protein A8L34_29520 [Bacillus sp. FJAT-27264]|nr:hypothetical protein A8L34_29520 [Bacillus sp. FJAT-27264]
MICSMCKVEMIHIEFPDRKQEVLGRNGRPLSDAVERCPSCMTDIPSTRRVAPLKATREAEQPDQLSFFTPTIGGLH